MPEPPRFSGAKIALLCDSQILIYQRDDKESIPWPGHWDLPGGGREGDETPVECAIRETHEEFGLTLDPGCIVWQRMYPAAGANGLDTWFLVARVPRGFFNHISFGNEGQRWEVTTLDAFLARTDAIEHLQERLKEYLLSADNNSGRMT